MSAFMADGWLCADYNGPDAQVVQIGVMDAPAATPDWQAAFLDWVNGRRVAKVIPPPTITLRSAIFVKVGEGPATPLGSFTV